MATPQTTAEVIQLVGRDGVTNNIFDIHGMQRLISSSGATEDHYTVVSIIGPQSTGKSTLMNGIFNTNFTVMDASKECCRTTKGIWVSINNSSQAVVLDVEGTDSEDNQNDLGFETRSALFALAISDVIFFNIFISEVSRANNNPLLIQIFEELVKNAGPEGLPDKKTKFVVAVRNYDAKLHPPVKKMEETITSKINNIWKHIHQEENSKLEKYFQLHIELLPHYDYERAGFNNKCKEIGGRIARGDWVNKRLPRFPVSVFPSHANTMWKKIVQNRTLDLPSHRETMVQTTCGIIMTKKFEHFQSEKYLQITKNAKDDPKKFISELAGVLNDILSDYDSETQVYGKYAKDGKKKLKAEILEYANGKFQSLMKKLEETILKDATKEIDFECEKSTSRLEERINSVVTKYRKHYLHKTEGPILYKLNKEHFLEKLNLIGAKKTADIKKTSAEKALRITRGVMIGLASTATAVAVVATGPIAALVGATTAVVTCATAATVAATASGAAAAIATVQGQPHRDATVAPVETQLLLGNTEASQFNTSEPLSPSD